MAPTNHVRAVEDERGVRRPFPNAFFLHLAIILGRHLTPFWVEMEGDAPASAENPVVLFHEAGEGRPCLRGKRFRGKGHT